MTIKIYTKTVRKPTKSGSIDHFYGVIEGPYNKMLKFFPKEFSFLKHKTKRFKEDK